jgi:hypothetical protein
MAMPDAAPISEMVAPFIQDKGWKRKAKCKGAAVGQFYVAEQAGRPAKDAPPKPPNPVIADFCGKCVVRRDCLGGAIISDDRFGIQGGLSANDRLSLHQQYKKTGKIPLAVWEKAGEQPPILELVTPTPSEAEPISGAPTPTANQSI